MDIEFKKNGKLDPELFSQKAQKVAEEISNERSGSSGGPNQQSQLRKFYDEVLRFDSMLKAVQPGNQEAEFEKILPYIKMLNAKAAYAEGRGLVTSKFKDFISQALKQIKTKADFDIFVGLFEAFMGFYKYYEKDKSSQKNNNKGGNRR